MTTFLSLSFFVENKDMTQKNLLLFHAYTNDKDGLLKVIFQQNLSHQQI